MAHTVPFQSSSPQQAAGYELRFLKPPVCNRPTPQAAGNSTRRDSSGQSTRARNNKALLLPLPRSKTDELSLRNHVALESMRQGKGSYHAAQLLLEAMLVTAFLAETGHGEVSYEDLVNAESAICSAIDHGRTNDEWRLDDADYRMFGAILTLHDLQLQKTPLSALALATEWLTKFKAGVPFNMRRVKP